MRSVRDLSINTKLSLLVTLAVGVAMSLCGAAFLLHEFISTRVDRVAHLSELAAEFDDDIRETLAANDSQRAHQVLASLKVQRAIEFAAVYDQNGDVFAAFGEPLDEDLSDILSAPSGHTFSARGCLYLVQEVRHDGARIGTLLLHSRMDDLRQELLHELEVMLVVMMVSLGAAILVSKRFQRTISQPMLDLARVAQQISARKDYTIRVKKAANDEIGSLYDEFNTMLDEIQKRDNELQESYHQLEQRVAERTAKLSQANRKLAREVAERDRAERELESVHRQLVDAARRAGMAEVATDVLHNVGNVLNSVNVSSALLAERLRDSQISDLQRAMDLLSEHREDLPDFLANDEQGRQLPRFLDLLTGRLMQEHESFVEEVRVLNTNVGQVKAIVAMQQSYAGAVGVIEKVSIAELIQDAVRLNASTLEKNQIQLDCDVEKMPEVGVDRLRLLQILVNLTTNAKDALVASEQAEKHLTIRARQQGEDWVRIDVIDNGIGIAPADLTRIFSHGFTTKKSGHGFGLHGSANSAREMGGALSVHSDGLGRGCRFTIELPVVPMAEGTLV